MATDEQEPVYAFETEDVFAEAPAVAAAEAAAAEAASSTEALVDGGVPSAAVAPTDELEPEIVLSPEEMFHRHIDSWTGARMVGKTQQGAENLERRRYLLLTAALRDHELDLRTALANLNVVPLEIRRLIEATQSGDLQIAEGARDRSQLKSMSDLLRKSKGNAKAVLKEMTRTEKRLRDGMLKDGRLIKLDSGAFVRAPQSGRKVLTHEGLEKLLRDRPELNVAVRRDPANDTYLNAKRHDAMVAMAAVESGLQASEMLNDGVNEQSSALVKQHFNEVISASAYAMNEYRRSLDVITRRDGDQTVGVRIDLGEYYKGLKERRIPYRDLRELSRFNSFQLRQVIGVISDGVKEVLVVRELLDCAVYTPRLAALIVDQSLPRVIEFSRLYEVYFAALQLLQQVTRLPTQREVDHEENAFHAQFERAIAGHAVTRISDGPNQHSRSEPWRQMRTTKEMVEESTSRMLITARDTLFARVRELSDWYRLETRYHNGDMKPTEVNNLQYEPYYKRETYAEFPDIIAYNYYRELWRANQTFCISLLHSYEASILLYLQDYLPKEEAEVWRTRDILPLDGNDAVVCPAVTVDNLHSNNDRLTEWRSFDIDVRRRNMIADSIPAPPLNASLLERRVQTKHQPWSPTFRQMMQFHSVMNVLFKLPASEVANLFAARNTEIAAQRRLERKDMEKLREGLERVSLSTVVTPQSTAKQA